MHHLVDIVRWRRQRGDATRADDGVRADGVQDGVGRTDGDDVARLDAVVAHEGSAEGSGGVVDLKMGETGRGVGVDKGPG